MTTEAPMSKADLTSIKERIEKAPKLTKAQREQLELVATYKIPSSDQKRGFPAVRDSYFDGRVIPGLHRMGLVDAFIHEWWDTVEERKRYTVLVRITEAGRSALITSLSQNGEDA